MAYDRDLIHPHQLSPVERNFFSAPINMGVPVMPSDVNLYQYIPQQALYDIYNHLFTSGFLTISQPDSLVDFINPGINTIEVVTQQIVVHGTYMTIDQTGSGSNNVINDDIGLTSTNDPPTQNFQSGSPDTTHTQDVIFLEFWREELREDGVVYRYGNTQHINPSYFANDIVDTNIDEVTSARIQWRYRWRVVAGASQLDGGNVYVRGKQAVSSHTLHFTFDEDNHYWFCDTTVSSDIGQFDDVDGFVYALPVLLIERVVGQDDVADADLTDLRLPVQSKVTTFVNPNVTGDPPCAVFTFHGEIVTPTVTKTVSANATTIAWCNSNMQRLNMSAATGTVTVTMTEAVEGGIYYLQVAQGSTPRSLIWQTGTEVVWISGEDYQYTDEASGLDILIFYYHNGTYYATGIGKFPNHLLEHHINVDYTTHGLRDDCSLFYTTDAPGWIVKCPPLAPTLVAVDDDPLYGTPPPFPTPPPGPSPTPTPTPAPGVGTQLLLWLDAADAIPDSGTEIVGPWLSREGRNLLVQIFGNPQISLTGGMNSQPAVIFDGINDYLAIAGVNVNGFNNVWVYVVGRSTRSYNVFGVSQTLFYLNTTVGGNGVSLITPPVTLTHEVSLSSYFATANPFSTMFLNGSSTIAQNIYFIATMRRQITDASGQFSIPTSQMNTLFVDTTLYAQGGFVGGQLQDMTGVGTTAILGATKQTTTPTNFLQGHICEVIVVGSPIYDASAEAAVSTYLVDKYT